jgi:hypothetical protein
MARVGRAADQVGQAADHPAGALVQVLGLGGQGAGLMAVQAQGGSRAAISWAHSSR